MGCYYPIPCPTRQDELLAKMGKKYPSKMMVFSTIICRRREIFVPLHCRWGWTTERRRQRKISFRCTKFFSLPRA